MYLTAKEIKDLAEYAGFEVLSDLDESDLEAEFYVNQCHSGVKVSNDDSSFDLYNAVVSCDGCEGNECVPLGDPIDNS
jgi:hypothetical protein